MRLQAVSTFFETSVEDKRKLVIQDQEGLDDQLPDEVELQLAYEHDEHNFATGEGYFQ